MTEFVTRSRSFDGMQFRPHDPESVAALVQWFNAHEQSGGVAKHSAAWFPERDRLSIIRIEDGLSAGYLPANHWILFNNGNEWFFDTPENVEKNLVEVYTFDTTAEKHSDGRFVEWLIREREGLIAAATAESLRLNKDAHGVASMSQEAEAAVDTVTTLVRAAFGEPDSTAGAKADRALVASYLNHVREDLAMEIGKFARDRNIRGNGHWGLDLIDDLILYLDDDTFPGLGIQDPAADLDEAIGADQFATIPGSRVLSWLLTVEYRMPDDLTNRYRSVTSADMGHALALGLASVGVLTVENGGAS